eukprot:m.908764 g.908764  ORF g.908764 m.908764 type:complete len:57 (-) comp23716_c0_seq1:36-206(-)
MCMLEIFALDTDVVQMLTFLRPRNLNILTGGIACMHPNNTIFNQCIVSRDLVSAHG